MGMFTQYSRAGRILAAVLAVGAGCFSVYGADTFIDSRDKQKYRSVTIGDQTWMADNLNYEPKSGKSWCYEDNESFCMKYGRLYDWETANKACPPGWHLPTRDEWATLEEAVGGIATAGKALKMRSGWTKSAKASDDYGFSAMPGGYRRYANGGSFHDAQNLGLWWTATEYDDRRATHFENKEYNMGYAYLRLMDHRYAKVSKYDDFKATGLSVRCVQD